MIPVPWHGSRWVWVRLFVAAVFLAGLAGCGKKGGLCPVEGNVTVGGKPLTTGSVIFKPDADKGNTSKHEPRGTIDSEGHYQLVTANKPGAPPGWYKVAVVAAVPNPDNMYAPPKDYLVPSDYLDANTSGLSFEVVADPAPGAFDLKLPDK